MSVYYRHRPSEVNSRAPFIRNTFSTRAYTTITTKINYSISGRSPYFLIGTSCSFWLKNCMWFVCLHECIVKAQLWSLDYTWGYFIRILLQGVKIICLSAFGSASTTCKFSIEHQYGKIYLHGPGVFLWFEFCQKNNAPVSTCVVRRHVMIYDTCLLWRFCIVHAWVFTHACICGLVCV